MSPLSRIALVGLICSSAFAQRRLENLDRGVVAVNTSGSNVFVSWRLLGTEGSSVGFNIYRNGTKLNASVITGATNYADASGSASANYVVKTVINGTEVASSEAVTPFSSGLTKRIPLTVPSAGTTPSGEAYTYSPNDGSAGDLNGDGKWDIVLKWDPSNSKDNSQSGYTGNVYLDGLTLDGVRLWRVDLGKNIRAGAHYTQFVVADFDLDGKAEIICKTAPGTKDGLGKFLSTGPAASDNDDADYRNSSGYVLSGPEYLTVFRGTDGKELATVNYNPARGTVSSWGDSYGNRVDRFLATAAWLDGVKPSAVMQRGYYTRMAITAYDWNGTALSQRWAYNAANDGSECFGQGNHNLTAGDVDNDGKDELIEGACAVNDDGKFMYRTGLGHGDAMHLGDLDPNRAGLEVWEVHEDKGSAYGYEMHDAATGKIIWGTKTSSDNGRGLAADIDATYAGYEMWSASGAGTYGTTGTQVSTSKPAMNFRIYWDGDLQDEILDAMGSTPSAMKIDSWKNGRLVSSDTRYGSYIGITNNTTKANPVLVADLLGDWREEMLLRQDDNSALILYTTTIPTTNRLYTLMHDPVYRVAVSWQNTAYNQPPHLGFFLGNGTAKAPTPNIALVGASSMSGVVQSSSLILASSSSIAPVSSSATVSSSVATPSSSSAEGVAADCGGTACIALVQGENFCGADGITEGSNLGFSGDGYLNYINATGTSAGFVFQADAATNATMYIHYANGGATTRSLKIASGASTLVDQVDFPSTTAWTTWATVTVPVNLPAGRDSLVFTSLTADGGPNVDWIGWISSGINVASCEYTVPLGSPAPLMPHSIGGEFRSGNLVLSWIPQGTFTVKLRNLTGAVTREFTVHGSYMVPCPNLGAGLYAVEIEQSNRSLANLMLVHP